jgi:signal transduction histidine kinase/DNA-binding NarL/FixJ family response regulator
MFAVCAEVTGRVVGERRLGLLRDLPARASGASSVGTSVAQALEVLADHPLDVPFAAVYLRDGDGVLRRAGGVGAEGLPAEVAPGAPDPLGVARAGAGEAVLVEDAGAHLRATGGPWHAPVSTALALPLVPGEGGDADALGVLLAGVSPSRALDEQHRAFFSLAAERLSGAMVAARAYAEERDRVAALAELDRAKTAFFANVSHEFRTPLTLLLGPLEDALADDEAPLAPVQRERAELAARGARRLLKLVNGLLDFSRVQAGAWRPAPRAVDLPRLTADLASVFRAAIERAGLRLVVDCPPIGPPVAVDADAWEQVVLNLVSNAFKYTFTGEVRVALRREGDAVVLVVGDTGIGIPPGELPRLFERFHRVPDAEARTHEGTGIGLALVRDLVEAHGGSVAVASELGQGSAFTVTLPVVGAPEAAGAADLRPSSRAAVSVEEARSWAGDPEPEREPDAVPVAADAPRVLVADDNADMRRYLARILRPTCVVRAVADGEAALAAARAERPDVVLTDVMMPRLDGFGLLRALRADPRTAAVPVVMLSARSGPEAAVEGLRRGADDYLAKPFTSQELIARVHANAARGRRMPERAEPERVAPASPRAPAAAGPVEPIARERTPGRLRLELPALPGALRVLRGELRPFLAGAGLAPGVADGLVVAACEAATNAIEHAADASRAVVDVVAQRVAPGRVRIEVRDHGRWRARGASLDRGRGSTLMQAYADVEVVPSAQGTLVALTSRPAA